MGPEQADRGEAPVDPPHPATTPVTQGQIVRTRQLHGFVLTETRHAPGTALDRHAHSHAAVTVPLSGHFSESVEGRRHDCRPGIVLFKRAGAIHENHYPKGVSHALIIEVRRPPSTWIESQLSAVESRLVAGLPWALALRIHDSPDGGSRRLHLEEFLGEVFAPAVDGSPSRSRTSPPPWLRRVWERIEEEWRDPPTLADLGDEGGVHPVYLARAFRRYYRGSVGDVVLRKRLDAAIAALLERRESLSRLALDLGFYDQSHFTRAFRGAVGMAPGAFQRRFATAYGDR